MSPINSDDILVVHPWQLSHLIHEGSNFSGVIDLFDRTFYRFLFRSIWISPAVGAFGHYTKRTATERSLLKVLGMSV